MEGTNFVNEALQGARVISTTADLIENYSRDTGSEIDQKFLDRLEAAATPLLKFREELLAELQQRREQFRQRQEREEQARAVAARDAREAEIATAARHMDPGAIIREAEATGARLSLDENGAIVLQGGLDHKNRIRINSRRDDICIALRAREVREVI